MIKEFQLNVSIDEDADIPFGNDQDGQNQE